MSRNVIGLTLWALVLIGVAGCVREDKRHRILISVPDQTLLLLRDGAAPDLRRWILRIGVAGLVLAAAFEPVGFAWLLPPAIAALVLSVRGLGPGRAWLPTLLD